MTTPKKYRISNLLLGGAQPFKNLDPETREYLTATIKTHGNLRRMPVLLSADGILYDGHQRLMILAELGRKEITAGEFIINPKVAGREQAYEEAMKTNFNRRHLSGKDKAAAMWELRRQFKLSQTTIARMLDMRQPSVSQLMNRYRPDDADTLTETIGEDGRVTINPRRSRDADITAKDDTTVTPYEARQRIKKRLNQIGLSVSHLVADSQSVPGFSTFEERDSVTGQIAGIIGTLTTVADKFAAPPPDA